MHPQTLRKYERLGWCAGAHVGSMRSTRATRSRLRFIKRLSTSRGQLPACSSCWRWPSDAADPAADAAALAARRDARLVREMDQLAACWADRMTGSVDFKDYYTTLGVSKTASRQGDQAGLPEAGAQVSPGRESRRQGRRGQVQGSERGQRGAERSGEAQEVRRAWRELARVRERAAGRAIRTAVAVRRRRGGSGARGGPAASAR